MNNSGLDGLSTRSRNRLGYMKISTREEAVEAFKAGRFRKRFGRESPRHLYRLGPKSLREILEWIGVVDEKGNCPCCNRPL